MTRVRLFATTWVFFALLFLPPISLAGPTPILSALDITSNLAISDSEVFRLRLRGGIANMGEAPVRHVKLRARLVDRDGAVIESIESVRLDSTQYSAFTFDAAVGERKRKEQYLSLSLESGQQVRFEFFFNRVLESATSVEVAVLYSPNLFPTPILEHTVYVLPLDSRQGIGQATPKDGKIGRNIWDILQLGMTVAETKTALQRSGYSPYTQGGMKPGLGTVFIATYEVGGTLKLHFHENRLFSYRSLLVSAPDRQARQVVLVGLANDFQGVILGDSGVPYFSEKDSNTYEFSGASPSGDKVETQGDWLLVYDEKTLKEVQRMEYQGR